MSALNRSFGESARIRALTALLALAALLLLAGARPQAAHAAGCSNNWEATGGGAWSTPGNWSRKAVPVEGEEVCITKAGTYTVSLAPGVNTNMKSITVGGGTGTQTLAITTNCSGSFAVGASSGFAIEAQGALSVSSTECGYAVRLEGPITNAGSLTTLKGAGGERYLRGNLTNTGTINVDATTAFDGKETTLTNEGTINLEGFTLEVNSGGSITDGTGGKIAAGAGASDVVVSGAGDTYTQGAGTTSGATPVYIVNAALDYTGKGASSIFMQGTNDTLAGNLSSGQSLTIENTCAGNLSVSAAGGFTNAGQITLTNTPATCGYSNTLTLSSGTLTNTGSITTEKSQGGGRVLQGNIENKGTVQVNTNTTLNAKGSLLTNEGAINIAAATVLEADSGASIANDSSGTINATGTGVVVVTGEADTFTEGAGTTSGTTPVDIINANLDYSGAGASTIIMQGTNDKLAGNLSSGQSLTIENTCAGNLYVSAAGGFSNAGQITLTNTASTCGYQNSLALSTGTLTNTGTITTEKSQGGGRVLQGNIDNKGTIQLNTPTVYNAKETTLTNEGQIDIAEGVAFEATGGAAVTNATGGSIATSGNGVLAVAGSSSTFTEAAGTTSGATPVDIINANLDYTGAGASTIIMQGTNDTLAGNLSAGQSLTIENTCQGSEAVTAAASFTNGGTITLTNTASTCGYVDELALGANTLTNSGTIETEKSQGGAREIYGDVINKGTIDVNTETTDNAAGASFLNEGTINLTATFELGNSPAFTNEAGTIAGGTSGTLSQVGGTFEQGAGKETGTTPVLIKHGTLDYTGKGTGTITLRATSNSLEGNLNKGQILMLENSCEGSAEITAAAAFVNSGTIDMLSTGCGYTITLNTGGATIENKGTINIEHGVGGSRVIKGAIVNEKTLYLKEQSLSLSGSFTNGKKGTFEEYIPGPGGAGTLAAGGAVSLQAKLKLVLKKKTYVPVEGEHFTLIEGSSLTGTFTKVTGTVYKKKLEFKPAYTPTQLKLEVVKI